MAETGAAPVLSQPQTPPDPREGLTHLQRTDPGRLFREYEQYFIDERVKRDAESTGWERLQKTWYNWYAGVDAFEHFMLNCVILFGGVGGVAWGVFNDSAEPMRQFHKQHDEFVHAGHLKEKWQLTKVAYFRTAMNGIRMGTICLLTPMGLTFSILSSLSYRNDVKPLDFAVIFGTASALFNIKKPNSVILRRAGVAFGFGFAAASAIRTYYWVTGKSVSEFRYWAVTRRDRSNEMMSRKSWERYKDIPEVKHLHERELDLQESWARYREKLAAGERVIHERPTRFELVLDQPPQKEK